MLHNHFYHEHTRRAVAVFGTLFNGIDVVKRDNSGRVISSTKVPLSYGPRQKFLARIKQEENLSDPKLAIKLPRMSFEISAFDYDESMRLTRGTGYSLDGSSSNGKKKVYYPSVYRIGFELNIISKTMDDALQILEQIVPFFQPEYTVTVHEVNDRFKSDMPFTLQSVTMNDDYEGDFLTRRAIIYTLTFETKVKYYGPVLPDDGSDYPTVKAVKYDIGSTSMEPNGNPYEARLLSVTPKDASENESYTVDIDANSNLYDRAVVTLSAPIANSYSKLEAVIGAVSGTTGRVFDTPDSSTLVIGSVDGLLEVGESITGATTGTTAVISGLDPIWDTLV